MFAVFNKPSDPTSIHQLFLRGYLEYMNIYVHENLKKKAKAKTKVSKIFVATRAKKEKEDMLRSPNVKGGTDPLMTTAQCKL
jgi:hypothetical protein